MVTLEHQRKVAKELQDYFKQKKLDEADQGPFFGFLGKNETSNGREGIFKMELEALECCSIILDLVSVTQECYVCQMGDIRIAVGLLTEYATGASFVQQLKILLSNFGIIDFE